MDPGSQEDQVINHQNTLDLEPQGFAGVTPRWIHASRSFNVLKAKIVRTPILRDFDPDQSVTVVVYVSDWSISGSLVQEYDYPVMFASSTLKSNELNYGIAEKAVLALLRILDLNTMPWLDVRSIRWDDLLLPWTIEITKCVMGEDEILGALAVSITPRAQVVKEFFSISRTTELRRMIQAPISNLGRDEYLYTVSVDGSTRVKKGVAPTARSCGMESVKGNEAEFHGLVFMFGSVGRFGSTTSSDPGGFEPGEIDCKAPGLTLLRLMALDCYERGRITSCGMLNKIMCMI
ncbi:reverse transcriptase [Phytophthora megakarya]|uniref:Reverse transcriptase n=1 Tax=Phytophthora megakarya TaxID=4795 RepID=A0A225WT97_9STRA|nr:reverse transcriptase [Phytophthora megakarya]